MTRGHPTIVVQETHGNWSGLLRRQLAADNVSVTRVETLDDVCLQLRATTGGFFAVQIDEPSAAETLDWLCTARRRFRDAGFCGICSAQADAWAVYEAGASLVIGHPLEVPSLARLVRRYFAVRFSTLGGSAGVANMGVANTDVTDTGITAESVELSLPWSNETAWSVEKPRSVETPPVHRNKEA